MKGTGHQRLCPILSSILLLVLASFASAQTCPNSSTCKAVVGSLTIPSVSTPTVRNRVVHAEQASPDGLFTDNAIGFTYNRSWNSATGFARDDITQPTTWLGLESYWVGSTELNIDLSPAKSTRQLRPFGFTAKYDGSVADLSIGTGPYAPGAGGVTLGGGTSQTGLVSIQDRAGSHTSENMLLMLRQDGTASFAWRAGGPPRLNFSLQPGINASGFGNYGILKFAGGWDHGEPLMEFEDLGASAILLNSYAERTDVNSRLAVLANGEINWGSGVTPLDTDLYRSAAGTLHTDGNLAIGGNLMVTGSKAAVVQTASYGKREVFAIESPSQWFEDFGTSKLFRGRAVVPIDPVFGETVTTGRRYHVFLTPDGPCTLYVERKAPTLFTVKSLHGSTTCRFDYRVVAKRKGHEDVRLAEVRVKESSPVPQTSTCYLRPSAIQFAPEQDAGSRNSVNSVTHVRDRAQSREPTRRYW